jgi:hypothetical protein
MLRHRENEEVGKPAESDLFHGDYQQATAPLAKKHHGMTPRA